MAQDFGGHSMVAPLRRVLVRRPAPPATDTDQATFGYPEPPDHAAAVAEFGAFVGLLQNLGVDVIEAGTPPDGLLDAIFPYDPSFTTDEGMVLCRPGKEVRLPEVELARQAAHELGIPIVGEVQGPGTIEGGDMCWIDEHTLAVGEGYRTNSAGIDQLQIFMRPLDVDIIRVPLPYWHGPAECLHLLSLISPVDARLAVTYLPLLPVPFVKFLINEGWSFIEIPDEEFATQGCNVLAVAPRKVVALKDNRVTIGRMEAAGIEVHSYAGDEISHNRTGGPTCLTRPILREV